MRCEEVADRLPQILDGIETADPKVVRHAETCLRCQAELVQYRRLLRLLRQLRSISPEPPPGAVADVFAALEEAAERGAIRSALSGRGVAYLGGLAVAAGAAGAVVALASRGRGRRLGLAS